VLEREANPRHGAAQLALAELLLDAGRSWNAIVALAATETAGASELDLVPLLERAARLAGDDRALRRALEAKTLVVEERATRREIERELREVRQRLARLKEGRNTVESPCTSRSDKADEEDLEGRDGDDDWNATITAEDGARPTDHALADGARLEPKPSSAAHREAASRAAGPGATHDSRPPSILPWLVLVALVLAGLGTGLVGALAGK
jgi:hypothetical protein